MDTTRRNNLLYFRDLQVGTLDCASGEDDTLAKLFAGEKVSLRRLVPPTVDPKAGRKLKAIVRKAQSNMDEKGLQTLFLAYGMATWPIQERPQSARFGSKEQSDNPRIGRGAELLDHEGTKATAQGKPSFGKVRVVYEDGSEAVLDVKQTTVTKASEDGSLADPNRPPLSAVILLPVSCSAKNGDFDSATIEPVGLSQVNMVLTHVLRESFDGLDLNEEELLEAGRLSDEALNPDIVLQRLRQLTAGWEGFEVSARAVLGNFSFQKLAMVKDLKDEADGLEAHDMIDALAGDVEARNALGGRHVSVEPSALDAVLAENEFMVLDADSSQQVVVHSVASDLDGVIQGPPGCGKSQTIANVIATLVAQGKRVLFVAEKRAALEAVYKRLEKTGLAHLTLDLHGAAISQKAVMLKVASTLKGIPHTVDPDDHDLHAQFEDRRRRVVDHAQTMHKPLQPSGLGPYQIQVGLIETGRTTTSKTRWRGPELIKLTKEAATKVEDLLSEARGLATLIDRTDPSPWTHSSLIDGQQVQLALDAAQRLSCQHLPSFIQLLTELTTAAKLPMPKTLGEAERAITLVGETNEFLTLWQPEIFDTRGEIPALSPATKGTLAILWATLTDPRFRFAKRRMAALSHATERDTSALLRAALRAAALADRWRDLGGSSCRPLVLPMIQDAVTASKNVTSDLSTLTSRVPGVTALSLEQLVEASSALAADDFNAHRIPTVRSIESQIEGLGAASILIEIRSYKLPSDKWITLFRHAYYASCYDSARASIPSLAAFRSESHAQFTQEFQTLDRERLRIAASRVSREHAERAIEVMNSHKDQTLLVRTEAAKRSRHLPLSKLVAQAADVLTAVCPCWMSSPLNVSQLLPADRQYFDVVIFDEASQVLPEDAACSVLRGRRLVVAGDQHQLPPTTFFADGGDDEEEDSPIAGFESLLDQLSSFVDHWPLEWHYRSRDERLIAFSNRHVYGNSLTTFPGVGGFNAVSHVYVDTVPRDGEEQSNSAEVQRVVELIIMHAEREIGKDDTQWESLGVIAMGITHANRVQAALDRALEGRHDLDRYFDPNRAEAFFVKNIERVQGDERDHVFLTLGYTRGRAGKFNHGLLGPINGAGGYRRLNVAVTRARESMTLVSAITFRDVRIVDPAPTTGHKDFGVHLFRLYLEFVESGGIVLGDTGGSGQPMNGFEADIFDALTLRGVPLVPQYGVSGYRLDFAATHPQRSGEFVLAIECDGASYHSTPTARDRDRLREQQLRSIGWNFHRIWSTDWFQRREQQIESAVAAWEEAVRFADARLERRMRLATRLGGLFQPDDEPLTEPISPQSVATARVRTEACPSVTTFHDLVKLITWIRSDGLLRTDDEIIRDALPRIGYQRKGPRIEAAILDAIRQANTSS